MAIATGRRRALSTPARSAPPVEAPTVVAPAFRLPLPPSTVLNEQFVRAARRAGRLLPDAVSDAITKYLEQPCAAGALRIRAMPVGDVPRTPARAGGANRTAGASEFALLAVALRLGEPVGYVQEHGGGLVQDIVPAPADTARQLSTSSSVTLEWHTETAFHPHKPRHLLLLCLRGDPEAKTMLCAIADVLPRVSDRMVATLRQRRFRTRPDASFLDGDGEGAFGPAMPVLAGDATRSTFTYDEDLMIGVDEEAQAVLAHLGQVVHECATEVVLEAGDLLVVDNHQVVHARSPFRARFDGTDRWLQRAFVVSDLRVSADERSGRIITTRF
jgi:hypothetical protein